MKPLNDKEKRMLDYITDKVRSDGFSPTVRDIKDALNIKSTATVHSYLTRLRDKGYIQMQQGKSRTLMPSEGIAGPLTRQVPIIGGVTAGKPVFAVENFDGYVDFTEGKYGKDELFALRVTGDSMIEAGILDGDIVIVRHQSVAENGEIIVALIDDSATVKTFYRENGHFRLQPENRTMDPIIVDSLSVLGKVVASIRYYR
ncbi:MAG: transcriptional repressor LexA [Clostridia bacterium]|nr:transcriptional repressor LexA [Clostridia bacterium]